MTLTNIRSKIRYLLGDISTNNYSDINVDRAINDYYNNAISIALKESGSWEVQGEVATADLVADKQEYVCPTDLLNLKRIEVNFEDADDDVWQVMKIKDMTNIHGALSNQSTSMDSSFVRLYDNSIFFENPIETDITAGIKIYYSVEATALSDGAHTTNLPEHLNSYLIHGACLDYSIRIANTDGVNLYRTLLQEDEARIILHYTSKLPAVKTVLKVKTEHYD